MTYRKALVLIWFLTILELTIVPVTQGQQKKLPRIGFLSPSSANLRRAEREAFWQGMAELGYIEGQNIQVEYRYAEGKFERLPNLASELASINLDAIVAHTTPGAVAAQQATSTIPVITTNAGDPVGSKLITSLARPGGNITGLSMLNVELGGKRLDILKEVVPKLPTVFLLWNPANHGNLLIKNNTEMIARAMTIRVQSLE